MAGPEDWGAQPAQESPEAWGAAPAPQGLLAQGVGMLGTSEGRSQLMTGVAKLPMDVLKGTLDWFETPGKAAKEGLTPAEEIGFGFNTALATVGSKSIPRGPVEPVLQVAKEFQEGIVAPAAQRLDSYARTGDPNGVRLEPPIPEVKPSPIRPVEGSPFAGVPTTVAAKTGVPEIDSVLNSPVTNSVINNPVIDRSHDVPYMAGGSTPLNDPTVYIDKHVPREQTVNGVTFDPAEPWSVHENVEQHTMELLIKGGVSDGEAYRVAHFEFAEPAEQAWYRAHGIDQVAAEKEQASWLPRIQHENPENPPPNLYKKPYPHADVKDAEHESVEEAPPTAEEKQRAFDIIRNAPELQQPQRNFVIGGPPKVTLSKTETVAGKNNRYEIHGENGEYLATARIDTEGDTATVKNIFAGNVNPALLEGDELKQTLAETQNALGPRVMREVLRQFREQHPEVKNIEGLRISGARQGGAYDTANEIPVRLSLHEALQQARELGVIGDDTRPSLNELPPKEAGRAAMAAQRPPDKVTGEVGGQPERTAWRKRWEDRLDNIGVVGDARDVITAAVDANDEFVPARQGNMSPGQIEQLGSVTGLDTTRIDIGATSSKIKNDVELRNTVEAFRITNDKIKQAAIELRRKNGLDDEAELGELTKLELQRDMLLDATTSSKELIALRAEFARSGHTLNEFYKAQREANGLRDFLKDKEGKSPDDVRERARLIADTPEDALPKVLSDRGPKKPGWLFWTWQNGLISGPVTHTKYAEVNTATVEIERTVAPELAAVIGKMRGDKVSLMAPLWANVGMVRALPDAFRGAAQAFKTGARVPLEGEIELAKRSVENPELKGAQVPYTNVTGPDWGVWKRVFNEDQLESAAKVLGIPGRSANLLHTFYKILSERGAASTRAYEAAWAEGAKGDEFSQRYQYHLENPTNEALTANVDDAYSGAFMEKLGDKTGGLARALASNPISKWLFPFQHIPWNIERMTAKYSPIPLAGAVPGLRDLPGLRDAKMVQAIRGELGRPAQNLAYAKVVVGSTILSYFAWKGYSGTANGGYPVDPKKRREWALMGIQPNTAQGPDGSWYSMDRFAMPGNLAKLGAAFGEIVKNYSGQDDHAMMNAAGAAALAMVNQVADETGFQTTRNFIDALDGKQSWARFLSWQVGSLMPFSSLLSQVASFKDPEMRVADGLMEGLKYRIPYLRETLLPKRDVLYGEPLQNPGFHTIFRQNPPNIDPVKNELDRLGNVTGWFPGAPQRTIGHVKLTDEQYDRYEATAGPLVKQMLSAEVNSQRYQSLPDAAKTERAKGIIEFARARARMALQMDAPHLIRQGIDNRTRQITGDVSTGAPQ